MADTTLDSLEEPQKPDTVANTATPHTSGHPASTDPWAAASSPADASSAGNSPAPDTSADPWNTAPPPAASDVHQNASDWLNTPAPVQEHINLMDPFQHTWIPLDRWVTEGINWLVLHFRPLFQGIRVPVDVILTGFQQLLISVPAPIAILVFSLLAWQIASFGMGVATLLSLIAIGAIGAWSQAMVTLALVLTALFFCIIIGLPLGIWLAHSERATRVVRPLLDAMQTTPAFVYLVPIVMLFGIGNVPGVVVTIIFALPPIVRLTLLGIRQVPADLVEAAQSFGASPRQMLFKVQLPLAMPTIMAGINQTLMLALSMVVIASMIAVGGLGQMVLRGIGRLDMGLASIGGVSIVILAIILDRLTQSLGQDARSRGNRHWSHRGPLGLLLRPFIAPRA